jgi:hypothetical protein
MVPILGFYVLQVQFWHVEHYDSRVVSWSRRWEVAVEELRAGSESSELGIMMLGIGETQYSTKTENDELR